jgi:hypothetical protein
LLSARRPPLALGTYDKTQQNRNGYHYREQVAVFYCLHVQILLIF